MAVSVKPSYSDVDEVYPTGVDWDIDRDRDLFVYDSPAASATYALAVYPAGSWQRVGRDGPPSAPPQ